MTLPALEMSRIEGRDTWVFDLDNTLYPAECDLFAQIDQRMTDFVARFLGMDRAEARALQKQYYAEHGTTLKGLMTMHGMDPAEFLAHVHEIDLSPIPPLPSLCDAIAALPGRKIVYTNGSRGHAERVTKHMELHHHFHGMFGIEDAGFHPKPSQAAYDAFCDAHEIDPGRAVFFEDLERNLKPAHEMGFATVLVRSGKDWSHEPVEARPAGLNDAAHPHVDYLTDDLTGFIRQVLAFLSPLPAEE
ncbi:pyrimidine 5'-nucleotidase [Henriciella pelagia]|uniref:Pyrimidine 5'-nucleotidase n=1 Tax=Henriciella pelagia TaxID=1977912 RepID=A0ABQ1JX71_9PROT|nr:pyrimidine 5'-nucleotidase [Henriciella pelagia]GGB77964.1 pyrimidine 5'-nucleotidase [Henriciella pelagia]